MGYNIIWDYYMHMYAQALFANGFNSLCLVKN